jgi:translation initiation factor IF-3
MTLKMKNDTSPLINEKIRFDKMQLISADGQNVGIVSREDALKSARSANLDLVIIAEQGGEGYPIAKVMDFGKASYAKKKQLAEAKKKQHVIQVKELKVRPKISEHDFTTKMTQGLQFLNEGKRLKITLMFKGREMAMREERGTELFDKIHRILDNAGLMKHIVQEKDLKSPQVWSRVYYIKK